MAQESSTAAVFRALVMLVCLIAIPLAAVFGRSLPEMLKKLFGPQSPVQSASGSAGEGEAPLFEPISATDSAGATPQLAAAAGQIGSDWRADPAQVSPVRSGSLVERWDKDVVPAGYESSSAAASGSAAERPADTALLAGSDSPPLSVATTAPVDRFTYIQDRLRQLGANYYLLESWGSSQQLYRFYCKMAVGGNPDYAYYFEAIDSDRLRAMARVLQQVEAWRAGQR